MGPCHYETLGVSREAETEAIKAAFRKLSLETHPDTVSGCKQTATARFQQLAQAAEVLTSPSKRELYDRQRFSSLSFDSTKKGEDWNKKKRSSGSSPSWFHRVYRPRNLVLYPFAFWATVKAVEYVVGANKTNLKVDTGDEEEMVEAWRNPRTEQYESPAP